MSTLKRQALALLSLIWVSVLALVIEEWASQELDP